MKSLIRGINPLGMTLGRERDDVRHGIPLVEEKGPGFPGPVGSITLHCGKVVLDLSGFGAHSEDSDCVGESLPVVINLHDALVYELSRRVSHQFRFRRFTTLLIERVVNQNNVVRHGVPLVEERGPGFPGPVDLEHDRRFFGFRFGLGSLFRFDESDLRIHCPVDHVRRDVDREACFLGDHCRQDCFSRRD